MFHNPLLCLTVHTLSSKNPEFQDFVFDFAFLFPLKEIDPLSSDMLHIWTREVHVKILIKFNWLIRLENSIKGSVQENIMSQLRLLALTRVALSQKGLRRTLSFFQKGFSSGSKNEWR